MRSPTTLQVRFSDAYGAISQACCSISLVRCCSSRWREWLRRRDRSWGNLEADGRQLSNPVHRSERRKYPSANCERCQVCSFSGHSWRSSSGFCRGAWVSLGRSPISCGDFSSWRTAPFRFFGPDLACPPATWIFGRFAMASLEIVRGSAFHHIGRRRFHSNFKQAAPARADVASFCDRALTDQPSRGAEGGGEPVNRGRTHRSNRPLEHCRSTRWRPCVTGVPKLNGFVFG